MEKRKRCCAHCHQSFLPCRNHQQHYCGEQACQNARKRDWRKYKRRSDGDYRENQQRANKKWQQYRSDYWRNYRQNHPDYTQRNREQARQYKQKNRLLRISHPSQNNALQFAKSDALPIANTIQNAFKPGTYHLIPATHSRFAKSDALIVTIAVVAQV